MNQPTVCIVILNYNGRELLERFLPAIARTDYQPLELVVVDNASTDDSVEWLRQHWPHLTVLPQSYNRFWAGGNNAGIRYALEKGHHYVAFANNDKEPHPAWIREAVRFSQSNPQFGMIGFRLFNQDKSRAAFEEVCRTELQQESHPVTHVDGCSLFCDSNVFRTLGLFDEDYLIYCEESDLEYRALQAGWQAAQVNVPVWHLGEATMQRVALRRAYLQMRNIIRFNFKLHGIVSGLRMIKTVLNRACNPWPPPDLAKGYFMQRYRPAGLATNAALAFAAIGWNLLHLPRTLRIGRQDRRRIALCRAQKGSEPAAQ